VIRLLIGVAIVIPLGLDLYLPIPEDNALTAAKVRLGRDLFRNAILSRDRTIACASCHDPRRAFTDGRSLAVGVDGKVGTRNAPTLINRVYGRSQFWDGRAHSLEQQVLEPIENPRELGAGVDTAVRRLVSSPLYRLRFRVAFGRDVNAQDLARALASYVRTILAGDSPFDRYANGIANALSDEARSGLEIFRGKAGCSTCHSGPTMSDERFHNTGVAWQGGEWKDLGRFLVTGAAQDRGAFKTPTLREVDRTAPYMHDGSLSTLDAVIDYYDRGGNPAPSRDADLKPLGLTADEKRQLIAFLRSLTGMVREGGF
jgi:cytochrome c peroxidase